MNSEFSPLKFLKDNQNQEISVSGWLHGQRGNNHIRFLQFRMNGKIIQIIAEKEAVGDESFKTIKSLDQESSIRVQGKVQPNEKAPYGYEINLKSWELVGKASDYPITPKDHGIDFLLDHRHLWIRSRKQLAILSLRNHISFAIRKFFYENGFTLIDTPILTGSVGESGGELFSLDYFDLGKAHLAQTGQLYLETAIFAHSQVYCFGPTFRAEKSKTKRHLTEFWMLEAEYAFQSNQESIDFQEKMIQYLLRYVLEHGKDELMQLERSVEILERSTQNKFIRLEYREAIELLKPTFPGIQFGDDINAEGENWITNHYGNQPVFIMNYPKSIKAFYMKNNPNDPETVLCADLIAPEGVGEIIGGSEREENQEILIEKIKLENLPLDEYSWYLDLRKYGSVPHSGFGMGLERFVSWITGVPHVRECIPYPRMIYRLNP
jgi:asparaginyl-tRNA synthetase